MVEKLLQFLVGHIYAQLLETVDLFFPKRQQKKRKIQRKFLFEPCDVYVVSRRVERNYDVIHRSQKRPRTFTKVVIFPHTQIARKQQYICDVTINFVPHTVESSNMK